MNILKEITWQDIKVNHQYLFRRKNSDIWEIGRGLKIFDEGVAMKRIALAGGMVLISQRDIDIFFELDSTWVKPE